MKTLIEENFKDNCEYVFRDPILFGDYRTALDEAEPRLYEDIQDFEASKALFQEVNKLIAYQKKSFKWKSKWCNL